MDSAVGWLWPWIRFRWIEAKYIPTDIHTHIDLIGYFWSVILGFFECNFSFHFIRFLGLRLMKNHELNMLSLAQFNVSSFRFAYIFLFFHQLIVQWHETINEEIFTVFFVFVLYLKIKRTVEFPYVVITILAQCVDLTFCSNSLFLFLLRSTYIYTLNKMKLE